MAIYNKANVKDNAAVLVLCHTGWQCVQWGQPKFDLP